MEAHIVVAFLAYCLTVTLRMKLIVAAPGLRPREALKSLAAILLVDVHVPITDGCELVMPRYTEPEAQQARVLEKLNLRLPPQPPPRISSGEVITPAEPPTWLCSADLGPQTALPTPPTRFNPRKCEGRGSAGTGTANAGFDVSKAGDFLGHADNKVTRRDYVLRDSESKRAVAESLAVGTA